MDKETNTARSYLAAQVKMSSSKQQEPTEIDTHKRTARGKRSKQAIRADQNSHIFKKQNGISTVVYRIFHLCR